MLKAYPALDIRCDDADLLLALLDDFHPTAVEDGDGSLRAFFATAADRDAARRELESRYRIDSLDVPDEDWARRSQENLQPITIGRLTIFPTNPQSLIPTPGALVILPSMGFGTGHHATTQLCLQALQTLDLTGTHLLDVGTGSGVLALAAVRLGAARAIGIDVDEDAIAAARENLPLNPDLAGRVTFEVADIASLSRFQTPMTGIVTANLTGALLVRSARLLLDAVSAGGVLVLSGLQPHERDEVVAAFAAATPIWEQAAGDWVGLAMKKA